MKTPVISKTHRLPSSQWEEFKYHLKTHWGLFWDTYAVVLVFSFAFLSLTTCHANAAQTTITAHIEFANATETTVVNEKVEVRSSDNSIPQIYHNDGETVVFYP